MSPLSYLRQKLWQAANALATGEESIQERLAKAAVYFVHLMPMDQAIPAEDREKLVAIVESLTSAPAGAEGSISATTRTMTPEEARRVADSIWDLFSKLCVDLS